MDEGEKSVGNEGLIVAHMALTVGVIGALRKKGILKQYEVTQIIDEAMLLLEEQSLSDPTAFAAHAVLAQLLGTLVTPSSAQPNEPL